MNETTWTEDIRNFSDTIQNTRKICDRLDLLIGKFEEKFQTFHSLYIKKLQREIQLLKGLGKIDELREIRGNAENQFETLQRVLPIAHRYFERIKSIRQKMNPEEEMMDYEFAMGETLKNKESVSDDRALYTLFRKNLEQQVETDYEECYKFCSKCLQMTVEKVSNDEIEFHTCTNCGFCATDVYPARRNSYKHVNHYMERMNQLQGFQNTTFPQEFWKDLFAYVEIHDISVEHLEPTSMREILSFLQYPKLYEKAQQIILELAAHYKKKPIYSPVLTPYQKEFAKREYIKYLICYFHVIPKEKRYDPKSKKIRNSALPAYYLMFKFFQANPSIYDSKLVLWVFEHYLQQPIRREFYDGIFKEMCWAMHTTFISTPKI